MTTYIELQTRVAQKLGIVPVGQDVSADDGTLIGQALKDIQAQLADLSVVFLDVENGVEDVLADPLAQMACAALVDEFGIAEPKRAAMLAMGGIGLPGRSPAERRLRMLVDAPTYKLATATDVTAI